MTALMKNSSAVDELVEFLVPNSNTGPAIVKGRGAEVEDESGRRYIDLEAGPGVLSVGHCHPKVVDAVRDQAGRLMQSPGHYHSNLALTLAQRISNAIGSDDRKVFFANSGAEANDGAIKISLKHAIATGKQGWGILAFEHGFHGRLSLPLSLTGMAARKKGFGPYATFPGVVHVPAPYCYRCPFGEKNSQSCGLKCADAIEDAMKTKVPGEAAIMIAEPILGVGGIIVPPDGYWAKVQDICARYKITLIQDEIFTGFGRTGKAFAHQHWNVKADVVTFAKAIGGGLPLGGFAATHAISAPFDTGDHFTTFGSNNQVGLAAGHAVLDVLESEKLSDRAAKAGARFMVGLEDLKVRYESIGDVRGKGLMIGVELVTDRNAKTPAAALTKSVQNTMRDEGVLVSTTGVHNCVMRITPPLVLSDVQIDKSLEVFESALAQGMKKGHGGSAKGNA
jgi:4-aminobutyrate aminotransferase/(S)-3-amino-2-methylpropionate transaminase